MEYIESVMSIVALVYAFATILILTRL